MIGCKDLNKFGQGPNCDCYLGSENLQPLWGVPFLQWSVSIKHCPNLLVMFYCKFQKLLMSLPSLSFCLAETFQVCTSNFAYSQEHLIFITHYIWQISRHYNGSVGVELWEAKYRIFAMIPVAIKYVFMGVFTPSINLTDFYLFCVFLQ